MANNPYFPAEITPWPSLSVMMQAYHYTWKKIKNESPPLPALQVLIAHTALETGWGKECYCYNLGNVKAPDGWTGGVTYYQGNETFKSGTEWFDFTPGKLNRFRAFATLQEGVDSYIGMKLNSPRYSKCIPVLLTGDAFQYAQALKAQGYFTADAQGYGKSLESVKKMVLNLPMPAASPAQARALQPDGIDPLQRGGPPPKPFNPFPPKGSYRSASVYAKKMGWSGADDTRPLAPMPKPTGAGDPPPAAAPPSQQGSASPAPAQTGPAPAAGAGADTPAPAAGGADGGATGATAGAGGGTASAAGQPCFCPRCGKRATIASSQPAASAPAAAAGAAPAAAGPAPAIDSSPAANPVSGKFQKMLDYLKFSYDGRGTVYGPMNLKYDKEKNLCIANNRWSKESQPKPEANLDPWTQGFACSTLCSWICCYWLNINDQWANYIGNNTAQCINKAYEGKGPHYNADFAAYFTPLEDGARKPWSYWLENDKWKQGFSEFAIGLMYSHVITVWRLGERIQVKDRKNGNKVYEPGLYRLAADGNFTPDRAFFSANPLTWKRIDTDAGHKNSKPDEKKDISIWVCKNLRDDAMPDGGAYARNPIPELRFGKLETLATVPTMADAGGKPAAPAGGAAPPQAQPTPQAGGATPAPTAAPPPGAGMPEPKDGLTGSKFIKDTWSDKLDKREAAILSAMLAGNYPKFLKDNWKPIQLTHKGHKGTAWVLPEYLCIGTDQDFVRMPMMALTAQKLCDTWNCILPTIKLVEDIYAQSQVKIVAGNLPPTKDMVTNDWFQKHHAMCEKSRGSAPMGQIMAGHKKDVVLAQDLLVDKPTQEAKVRVAIWGWWLGGRIIQNGTSPHHIGHTDYAQGIRLVKNMMEVDGKQMKVADVMQDKELCGLLSKEGTPITVTRYPAR